MLPSRVLFAACASILVGLAGSWSLAHAEWLRGLAQLTISVALLRWPGSIWSVDSAPELSPTARRWGVIGVTLLAACFRLWRIEQPGLWGDDAINGLLAFDILDGHITSPFQIIQHSHSSFHALSDYPIAAAFRLFGADVWTLRLPGVLMGIAGAPLLYGIAAPLFGARVGLLAALFYASSPLQIIHSKELVQIMTGELFLLSGLCLLVCGLTAARRWLVIAAGLPLALCVYTYHSARIVPVIALIFALAWIWRDRRHQAAPRRRGLVPALCVFMLALVPAAYGWIRDPDALLQRVNATSIFVVMQQQHSWAPLWDSIWRTLATFHYQQGPEYHWFGLGFDPAFNLIVGTLLVQGLIAALLGWQAVRGVLLFAWVAVGLAPSMLSSGAPHLYRAIYAAPPLYIFAALPLAQLYAAARAWHRRGFAILATALAIAVPVVDFHYYFYRVYTHPVFHWFQGERIVQMARTLREYGPGWRGYILADNFDAQHETLLFLARAWHLDLRSVASLADVLPLRDLPAQGALYMFSEALLPAAAAARTIYPGNMMTQRYEPTLRSWALDRWWPLTTWPERPRMSGAFLAVPRAALEHPNDTPPIGLIADYDIAGRHVRRVEPYPFYDMLTPTFPGPFRVRMHGGLTVPPPGDATLSIDATVGADAAIDGHAMGARDVLSAGRHDFALAVGSVDQRLVLQIWWTLADGRRELVPPRAFSPDDSTVTPQAAAR